MDKTKITKLGPGDRAMFRQIVDRCHVSDSDDSVLQYVVSRLKPGAWDNLTKGSQGIIRRYVKAAHARNRKSYRQVMGGRLR